MSTSQKTGDLQLGNKIAQRREELSMSRKELAAATDLSYAYISQIETGYRLPSAKHHLVLAKVLGMSLDELFGAEDAPPVPARSQVFAKQARVAAGGIAEPRTSRRPSIDEVIDRAAQEIESLPSSVRLEALSRVQLRIMQNMTEDQGRQRR